MTTPTIAILGGYGAVGATAADRLTSAGHLRIGGRDLAAAEALCDRLGTDVSAHTVDLRDPNALNAFCDGATVVLNCAGPSYEVLDIVARAAKAAGAHYVDVAGDAPLLHALHALPPDEQHISVVSAGVMPGLTAVLPQLLLDAGDNDRLRLDLHIGGAVRITPTSARDILLATGPDFGTSLASWRDGGIARAALLPRWNTSVPHHDRPVHALPYLTTETAALAAKHRIGEIRQYSVYVSDRIPTTLATAWADSPDDPTTWADQLAEAATGDLAEHPPGYTVQVDRRDHPSQAEPTASLVLHTNDPYRLSGVVAALTTRTVLTAPPAPGVHPAWQVLDPLHTWHTLSADPTCRTHSTQSTEHPL
jgi:hypothetical protein